MDLSLIGTDFIVLDIIDTYESVLWNDRYDSFGDFEIVLPISAKTVGFITENQYVNLKESEHTMIIEYIELNTDAETGNTILIKGHSLESVLDRRRVWPFVILNGDLEDSINTLISQDIENPNDPDRTIPNFSFEYSGDPLIEAMTVDDQFGPDVSVYEAVSKICLANGLGFKVTMLDGAMTFKLYFGKDRSYEQVDNPYVVFSPKLENILSGKYERTNIFEKTNAFVAGEKGIGNESTIVQVNKDDLQWTGLNRREMYVDASGITRSVPDEEPLTDAEYEAKLAEKGKQELADNTLFESFEGQIDTEGPYKYNVDYFLGDIVQVANEYGNEGRSRISEIVHYHDAGGIGKYPTFVTIT